MCYNSPLVRDKPLGVPAFVKLFYDFYAIYGVIRFKLTHFSGDDFENMRTLSQIIIKLEVWNISQVLELDMK